MNKTIIICSIFASLLSCTTTKNAGLEKAKNTAIEERRVLLNKGEITKEQFDSDVEEISQYTDY